MIGLTKIKQLVDGIRPILPLIRNTPYGKRIQSKLQREPIDGPVHFGASYPQHNSGINNVPPIGYGQPSTTQRQQRQGGHMADLYTQSPLYPTQRLQQAAPAVTAESYMMQSGSGLPVGAQNSGFGMSGFGNGFSGELATQRRTTVNNDTYARSSFQY